MMRPLIIAIGGGSGAGKTTLSNYLKEVFKDQMVQLPYDSYCIGHPEYTMEERAKINYDLPSSYDGELFYQHILALKQGQRIQKPIFDFTTHTRCDYETIEPRPIIVIEGIMIYAIPPLKDAIDIKIFVHADDDIRLARRLVRDVKERGRTVDSVISQYLTTVKPSFETYIAPEEKQVDFVFYNNGYHGLDEIETERLLAYMEEKRKVSLSESICEVQR